MHPYQAQPFSSRQDSRSRDKIVEFLSPSHSLAGECTTHRGGRERAQRIPYSSLRATDGSIRAILNIPRFLLLAHPAPNDLLHSDPARAVADFAAIGPLVCMYSDRLQRVQSWVERCPADSRCELMPQMLTVGRGLNALLCFVSVLCASAVITSPARGFKTLIDFNDVDGAASFTPLVQGVDGDFYGTTS